MRFTAPKGTNDILPEAARVWAALERLYFDLAGRYGYGQIRTPVFERTELFARGIGDATDIVQKEMFTFEDRGGRSLTLRPELTAGAVRAYIQHNLAGEGPMTKLCYFGPAFRQERPQAGRYQQFTQYGVEAFGSRAPALDAEVIDLALAYLAAAGLTETRLLLNSIGCARCRPLYREALIRALDPAGGRLCPTCHERLERNPLRVLDCKVQECQAALAGAPATVDYLCPDCAAHFAAVRRHLDALGHPYELAPRLVRGIDYYTNTVFEITAGGLGAQNSVLAGGRYDGLIEACGGPPTPGVGFAGGLERLILALAGAGTAPPQTSEPLIYLISLGEAAGERTLRLGQFLRRAGFHVDLDYLGRSLKAQLREADRRGARFAVIIGEEELAREIGMVKRLDGGGQTPVKLADLPAWLGRELGGGACGPA